MNGSLGRLENLKLLGSCQFIFQPEISGFENVDTTKSEGFHVNSENIQKWKHFLRCAIGA